jgi:fibronectin type 3 domain-containing protein
LPNILLEYKGMAVAKNETVSDIETPANVPRHIEFALKNTGAGTLTLTGTAPVSVTGSAFSVTQQPTSSTVAPGGALPFTITFTPPAVDTYTTTVTVKSNAPSGDFTFSITANGIVPKPVITILNGTEEVPQNGTVSMGNVTLSGTVDITVKNTGWLPLTVEQNNITITGADAAAFSFDSLPSDTISAGGNSILRIRYTMSILGVQSAVITIPNNDPLRNPAVFSITATGMDIAISVPTSITATANSSGSTTVSWNPVTGASLYKVYRNDASAYAEYLLIGTSNTASYTDTGLSTYTYYYYKISAVTSLGTESVQSDARSVQTLRKPLAPSTVTVTVQSPGNFLIGWSSISGTGSYSGASSYKIYRSGSANGSYVYIADSNTTSYNDTGLPPLTPYYYKVSSVDSSGGEGGLSDAHGYSAMPDVTVSTSSASSIALSWSSVLGATGYKVYRGTSANSTSPIYTSTSTNTTYTDNSVSSGTIYFYQVAASGSATEGPKSTSVFAVAAPVGSLSYRSGSTPSSSFTMSGTSQWYRFNATITYDSYYYYIFWRDKQNDAGYVDIKVSAYNSNGVALLANVDTYSNSSAVRLGSPSGSIYVRVDPVVNGSSGTFLMNYSYTGY